MTADFDRFRDRLSRDIRNELSESLLQCMEQQRLDPACSVADRYRADNPEPVYVVSMKNRLERYERFLSLAEEGPAEPVHQGFLLWHLGLYFEVHEVLERAWLQAPGEDKAFFQALIRAAGVHIKRQYGFNAAADKMAARALPVLERNRGWLALHTDPDQMLAGLRPLS